MILPLTLDPDWVLDAQSLMSRLGKESGGVVWIQGISYYLVRAAMDCVSGCLVALSRRQSMGESTNEFVPVGC